MTSTTHTRVHDSNLRSSIVYSPSPSPGANFCDSTFSPSHPPHFATPTCLAPAALPPHFLQNLQASGQLSHPHNLALGSPHDSPGLRSPATQVSPCTSFVSHVSRPPAPMSCEAPVPQPPPDNPQRPLSQPNIPVVSAATNTGVLSQLSSPIPRTANGTTSSTLLQQGPHTVLPGPSSIAASVGGVEQGAGPGNIAGMVGGQHIESPFGVEAVQQRSSLNGDLHEDLMYGSSQPVTSAATPQASPGVLPGTSTMSGRSALSGHESKVWWRLFFSLGCTKRSGLSSVLVSPPSFRAPCLGLVICPDQCHPPCIARINDQCEHSLDAWMYQWVGAVVINCCRRWLRRKRRSLACRLLAQAKTHVCDYHVERTMTTCSHFPCHLSTIVVGG